MDGRSDKGAGAPVQNIILYPLVTEKTTDLIDRNNTITFIVDVRADKRRIKEEVERLYGVKVEKVNTLITRDGRKKAYVKLKKEYSAADLATKLGVI